MKPVNGDATSWKKLDKILDKIAEGINLRTPLKGAGILLTEMPGGFIISVDKAVADSKDQSQTGQGGGGLPASKTSTEGWQSIAVIDQSDCSTKFIWYWGTSSSTDPGTPPPTSPLSL